MTDQVPDTSHYRAYDPYIEDVYPKGHVDDLLGQRDALRELARHFVPAGVNVDLTPWQQAALEECYRLGALE